VGGSEKSAELQGSEEFQGFEGSEKLKEAWSPQGMRRLLFSGVKVTDPPGDNNNTGVMRSPPL